MSVVLVLKLVHILSAITALGSNVTYAYWLRAAGTDRSRLVFAIEGVRRIDRTFANPAYVLLLLTGVGMVATGGYDVTRGWLATAIGLYVLTAVLGGAVYAPTIRRQLAEAERDPASAAYRAVAARSTFLGVLTIANDVVIVALMVLKPF